MQIEKINENQLEVILNLEDLKANNISIHSFMCNSTESQRLFFEILSLADEEIGFSIKNYEVVIEAFSVPIKSYFVLLFTRVPKVTYLHTSKTKYGKFKSIKSFWAKFNSFEDFCMFSASLEDNFKFNSSLYLLDGDYFLHIRIHSIKHYFKLLTRSYEFSNYIYEDSFILDENAEAIIKDYAVQTAKKYFV